MYVTGLSLDLSNLREHNFNLLSANLTKRETPKMELFPKNS